MSARDLLLKSGTVVDAILIAALITAKNNDRERHSEMHQVKKGKQRHFGITVHIGVDVDSGLSHTVVGTAGMERGVEL
ncbi:MAG: hypothetical protein EAZ11_05895 [Curvibacter sp.]|nr:MAG: hypothetical protein EAZ11_05895 [Curvibacter sp.]